MRRFASLLTSSRANLRSLPASSWFCSGESLTCVRGEPKSTTTTAVGCSLPFTWMTGLFARSRPARKFSRSLRVDCFVAICFKNYSVTANAHFLGYNLAAERLLASCLVHVCTLNRILQICGNYAIVFVAILEYIRSQQTLMVTLVILVQYPVAEWYDGPLGGHASCYRVTFVSIVT